MVSYTTFRHPSIVAKIDQAMREATRISRVGGLGFSVIRNKNNKPVGLVYHRRGRATILKPAFEFFWEVTGKPVECTDAVLQALRSSHHGHQ